MTEQTGSRTTASTPPRMDWRKSRHSNPDGSCLEVTVSAGRYLETRGVDGGAQDASATAGRYLETHGPSRGVGRGAQDGSDARQ